MLLYGALGCWNGLRRGLVQSALALGALIVAAIAAARLAAPVLSWANADFRVQPGFAYDLGRVIPASSPWAHFSFSSPNTIATADRIIVATVPPAQRAVVEKSFSAWAQAQHAAPGASVLATSLAHLLLLALAFLVIFAVIQMVLGRVALALSRAVPRAGAAGLANTVLGGVAGALIHLVRIALILLAVAVLGALPPLAALAGPVHHSRYGQWMLSYLGRVLGGADRNLLIWLSWF